MILKYQTWFKRVTDKKVNYYIMMVQAKWWSFKGRSSTNYNYFEVAR